MNKKNYVSPGMEEYAMLAEQVFAVSGTDDTDAGTKDVDILYGGSYDDWA